MVTNVVAVIFVNIHLAWTSIVCLIGDDASATVNIYTQHYLNYFFGFCMFGWCLLCVIRMGTSIDGRKPFLLPAFIFVLISSLLFVRSSHVLILRGIRCTVLGQCSL